MQKIPKCKTKYIVPQQNYLKVIKKETSDDNTINNKCEKIPQKKLKFSVNRKFGKDITNAKKVKIQKNLIENPNKNLNIEKKVILYNIIYFYRVIIIFM